MLTQQFKRLKVSDDVEGSADAMKTDKNETEEFTDKHCVDIFQSLSEQLYDKEKLPPPASLTGANTFTSIDMLPFPMIDQKCFNIGARLKNSDKKNHYKKEADLAQFKHQWRKSLFNSK